MSKDTETFTCQDSSVSSWMKKFDSVVYCYEPTEGEAQTGSVWFILRSNTLTFLVANVRVKVRAFFAS